MTKRGSSAPCVGEWGRLEQPDPPRFRILWSLGSSVRLERVWLRNRGGRHLSHLAHSRPKRVRFGNHNAPHGSRFAHSRPERVRLGKSPGWAPPVVSARGPGRLHCPVSPCNVQKSSKEMPLSIRSKWRASEIVMQNNPLSCGNAYGGQTFAAKTAYASKWRASEICNLTPNRACRPCNVARLLGREV